MSNQVPSSAALPIAHTVLRIGIVELGVRRSDPRAASRHAP